jgi:hypothetical protein
MMLRGSGDGLVDHLLVGRWVQVLQQAQRPGGHREAAPAAAGPVKHRPHQRQARTLAGEPADDLVRRRVSPKVRSIKFECRIRCQCSRGNRRCTVSEARSSVTQATAAG